MRALVTGATGKVGHGVARALVERGDEVRVLARDPGVASSLLPPGVEPVRGDVTDPASVERAVAGCELVFNGMGLPEQWFADADIFDRVNARGTETVVRAAAAARARRVVHTSTIDVFHAERGGAFDESEVAGYPKGTAYERSKQRAEQLALAAAGETGVEVVIVNPAAVYGPGPGRDATSLEEGLLRPLVEGKRSAVPLLPPGGMGLVYSTGMATGQLLAAERGVPGERYILCDGHMSFREIADTAVRAAGRGRVPAVMPVPVAKAIAAGGEAVSRVVRRPPLLPRGQLHFFLWDARPQSAKAQRELGWVPTPLEEGLAAVVAGLG
ncbi:MAG: NAD-dependent epimerase/dehydratase family protein [Thermoleophilaceae bacterium]|nr:NAD-dependent epimerase/dehydratase family protein [Thermoleophilaceae bacterium]